MKDAWGREGGGGGGEKKGEIVGRRGGGGGGGGGGGLQNRRLRELPHMATISPASFVEVSLKMTM